MASRDKKPAKPSGSGRIRTFADLNRQSDSDGESDVPQEFYTGGEKSGMLVQEPTKGNDVDALFNKAREMGAVEKRVEHGPSSSSRSFTGTGRLLSGETVPSGPEQPEAVVHNIVFWSDGFTVDDGPLRRMEDPENVPFIESIGRSECPRELEPVDRRSSVNVNLIKRAEKCPVRDKGQVSFQGRGRTLGSSSSMNNPSEASGSTSVLTTAPAPSIGGLVVDPALPVTSIQLRLADGTRLVVRFNLSHTVNDIRGFIDASRPGGSRDYQLQMMGFPPKVLTDVNQTVEDAGLANAVIIQKF